MPTTKRLVHVETCLVGQRFLKYRGYKYKIILNILQTMKKKFFVLRGNAVDARLEYYDSEVKFHSNEPAKRLVM